jgi:hypothetical protein
MGKSQLKSGTGFLSLMVGDVIVAGDIPHAIIAIGAIPNGRADLSRRAVMAYVDPTC